MNKQKITILAHLYNEEYLLPWWLNHHKQLFDHGILIDYDSTDNSIQICKDICPHWTIIKSNNKEFSASDVDKEIMFYESQIQGWRIALNITEFLVGNIIELLDQTILSQIVIPQISFYDWDPNSNLDITKNLWNQKTYGIDYLTNFHLRRARSLHNHQIHYPLGRHFEYYNYDKVLIFHYANCISSQQMLKRRLQIQHRIPVFDKHHRLGFQHYNGDNLLTEHDLYLQYEKLQNQIKDHDQSIKKVLSTNNYK